MENINRRRSLSRDLSFVVAWEVLLVIFTIITFFGLVDRSSDKHYELSRSAYQTKVDLYDLRIEDNSKAMNTRVETGL